MVFRETALQGAFIVEIEKREDERGFFARSWCQREYEARGFNSRVMQCNISFNFKRGTLRGLHYQCAPHEEAKLIRCTSGSIYDVIIDLRPKSPTFKQHASVVLEAAQHLMLFVPEGFAHGFETLEDQTEVFYQMSEFYVPEAGRGIRWNDPAFGIEWPSPPSVISERDLSYPDFPFGNGACES
jgi:dTDP-4-dehydrorhamnose 3,5-epimerase